MVRYFISKYTATASYKPEDQDLYAYAVEHGTVDPFSNLWAFTDLKQALEELSSLETTCEEKDGQYLITCYVLESEDI